MNRRNFLRLGSFAAAGMIWDPELLLWRPPKAMILVPAMPSRVGLSFAQLVALAYDAVLKEQQEQGRMFLDSAERNGIIRKALNFERDPIMDRAITGHRGR